MIGRLRMRLPVTAKIAFATAAVIGGVEASPTPPQSGPPLGTMMDVDLRRLGEAHHAVGVEIALLRHAVLHRDLAVERGAEPEDRAAFHLLGDGERIHDIVRIDGDRDAIHLELALGRDGDLRDMGAEAAHVVADGDAAPLAFRQRLAPVALLGGGVEHLEPVGLALEQLAPELVGILAACRGDLVDEALDREDVLVLSGRAPEPHRQVRVLEDGVDARVRDVVGVVGKARDRHGLEALEAGPMIPSEAKIEPMTLRIDQATGMPLASRPALKRVTACGRKRSWRMSSSRVQISFTGRCTALAIAIACTISSFALLRPKPPPTKQLWI